MVFHPAFFFSASPKSDAWQEQHERAGQRCGTDDAALH
jgi:hypothetical protein